MIPRLDAAINSLYEIFSMYPGNPKMDKSPVYGNAASWNEALYQKPLRTLSPDDLSRFAGKAISTWGTVEDYKHFLPRICELTAQFSPPYEEWIVFDKCVYGGWEEWPVREQAVLHEFLYAWFGALLKDESEDAQWEFCNYFAVIAEHVPDFGRLLTLWESTSTNAALIHLANFIDEKSYYVFKENILSGFQDSSKNALVLAQWLRREEIAKRLEKGFFLLDGAKNVYLDDVSDSISRAEALIRIELELK